MAAFWTSQNQLTAMQALIRGAGLSPIGAAGLVARWVYVEAGQGPTAVNPSSGAFGIAQWLDRKNALFNYSGTRAPSFSQQLNFAVYELNGSESRAGNVLRGASTPDEAARGASMYERAEGYNPATGRDNWTARTASYVPGVYALLGGTSQPPNVAQQSPSGEFQDSIPALSDSGKKLGLVLAGAGLLWLVFRG